MSNQNQKSKYSAAKLAALRIVEAVVLIVVILVVMFTQILGMAKVSGVSMETTFRSGETVLFNRVISDYSRCDVVCIKMTSGDEYIKRIVAIPGDTVDLQDGKLVLNGYKVTESYAMGQTLPENGNVQYPLTLGEGEYFVLGDNREESVDSRSFGPVTKAQIKGKIIN